MKPHREIRAHIRAFAAVRGADRRRPGAARRRRWPQTVELATVADGDLDHHHGEAQPDVRAGRFGQHGLGLPARRRQEFRRQVRLQRQPSATATTTTPPSPMTRRSMPPARPSMPPPPPSPPPTRTGSTPAPGTTNLNTGFTGGSGSGASGINLTGRPRFLLHLFAAPRPRAAQKNYFNTSSTFYTGMQQQYRIHAGQRRVHQDPAGRDRDHHHRHHVARRRRRRAPPSRSPPPTTPGQSAASQCRCAGSARRSVLGSHAAARPSDQRRPTLPTDDRGQDQRLHRRPLTGNCDDRPATAPPSDRATRSSPSSGPAARSPARPSVAAVRRYPPTRATAQPSPCQAGRPPPPR